MWGYAAILLTDADRSSHLMQSRSLMVEESRSKSPFFRGISDPICFVNSDIMSGG